jgi:sugar lactone lactonase YvrE
VSAVLTGLEPSHVLPGARLALVGRDLPVPEAGSIAAGGIPARVVLASRDRIVIEVPATLEGGITEVRAAWCPGTTLLARVGRRLATGLHQVDSPACDGTGAVYATYSGSRGQDVPVSIFRVTRDGAREPFASGIANPTSLALAPDGRLHVSSRFDGAVYRVFEDGRVEVAAADLGVACGLAFDSDGTLFVGDRTGTIFKVTAGAARAFATLPPSVAAFHLAMGPDRALYVSGPTLSPRDVVYRIDRTGRVAALDAVFGRPQGLAFDAQGTLHVAEALAGEAGIHRWRPPQPPALMAAAPGVIGLAFAPDGALIAATSDSLYLFA